ncbi:MAG: protein-tyrosine-phosphatase [Bermanella sp.]|jgi:protein-tyrosine-phosphatase
MKIRTILLTSVAVTVLSACGSTAPDKATTSVSNLPSWVLNPEITDGIAATDCVKYSGNISIDKKMATANSRLALAQQIDVRIEGLEKTHSNRVDANEDTTVGSTFISVSKQLTKQKLQGSRVVKSDIINIAGKEHFCVLTTLEPSATKDLFDEILAQSQRNINPADEKFLYQEFKAFQAEKDLDKEIKKLTN